MVSDLFKHIVKKHNANPVYRCKGCAKFTNKFTYGNRCDLCHEHEVSRCKSCATKFHVGIDGWLGLAQCDQCKNQKERRLAVAKYTQDYREETDRDLEFDEVRDPCPDADSSDIN